MRTLFLFALLAIAGYSSVAQKKTKPAEVERAPAMTQPPPDVFKYVEQMPEAPYNAQEYVGKNLQMPADRVIEGAKVYVQFIVQADGRLTDVAIAGSKRLSASYEQAALDVVKSMPPWKPGRQNGRPVKVCYMIPIVFRAQDTPPPHPFGEQPDPPEIFKFVEQMPEASYDVSKYISKNLQIPTDTVIDGGRVNVQFVVQPDGSITDAKTVGSKRYPASYERAAINVVRSMPPWKPAKQNGKAVKAYYTLPVVFKTK